MVSIPKLKKKVYSFLVGEEGKISKESLLKAGVFIGAVAFSGLLSSRNAKAGVTHGNYIATQYFDQASQFTVVNRHAHHASHSSHGSHTSHSSY